MRGTKHIVLLALSLLLIASTSLPVSADPITINRKRLADISDIVKEVTSSDFPELPKHSVLLYERLTGDSNNPVLYQPRIFTINADGSLRKQFDFTGYGSDWVPINPTYNVIQKMDVSISPQRFGMRRNVIYSTAGLTNSYFSIYGLGTIESNGTEDSAQLDYGGWDHDGFRTENRNIWGNASLTVKGIESKDVFVVAHSSKMDTTGDFYFKFFTVDRSESGWNDQMNDLSVEGGDSLGFKLWDFSDGIREVDITAGDFDGDGYKNEILLAWVNNYGIYAYVYRVTTIDGQNLKVEQFMEEQKVEDTDTWNINYWRQASVVALAGDFDGDGVQEPAVISRCSTIANGNDVPDDFQICGMVTKVYHFSSGGYDGDDSFEDGTYPGIYTGTLKATVADLNGDGQDEIALLVLQLSGSDIYPRLEFLYFNRGSREPNVIPYDPHFSQYVKGGAGDTSLLGYSLSGSVYNESYKAVEDFSIAAGPLTGTRGQLKLADDIVISHVNSDASRVFVIPTLLDADRNFAGFGDAQKIYENTNSDPIRRGGLITADFANEGLMLGSPTHTQDEHDSSYVAVLQALPYHVDNVAADGSLTRTPINYTFSGFGDMAGGIKGEMRVAYSSKAASAQSSNVSFGMASTTETISLLGDAGKYAAGYLKFRATEANIAGNFDPRVKAAAGALDSIMKFVTDKIDNTTTNASSYASSTTVEDGLDAREFDRVIVYAAPQHIWRYKILNNPLPSWYVLGPKADYVSKDFDTTSQDRYITFSMFDEVTQTRAASDTHSGYQARHEEGNFFSYPSRIEDIEGYTSGGDLISSPYRAAWDKADTSKAVKFEQSKIDSQSYDEHIQKSELTKTVSAIASFFGAKDPSPLPPYTSHSESFVKKYSSSEVISIDVFGRTDLPGEQAQHILMAMPYTTREGTMKVGTAVELINPNAQDSPLLWRTGNNNNGSRYTKYPDPALVLPYKYTMMATSFVSADSVSATTVRGLRFYVPSLDLDSDNSILGGLQYKISVPIYNASFKDTGDFDVRLSYIAGPDINLGGPKSADLSKLRTIQTVTMSLKGWQNGSTLNKGWAEFTWDVPETLYQGDSDYYFYIQIDPENKLTEVHESRFTDRGSVQDIGGNNWGHFKFSFASPGTIVAKRDSQTSGAFKAAMHSDNGTIYRTKYKSSKFDKSSNGDEGIKPAATLYDTTGTVNIHTKFDGYEYVEVVEFLAFLEDLIATDSRDYIPVECEIEYNGDEYYHEAYFYGVNYEPGTSNKVRNRYLVERLSLAPGKTVKFIIRIHPGEVDWINGSGFELVVPELAGSSNGGGNGSDDGDDYDDDDDTEAIQGVSSSGGGCGAMTGSLAMMVFAGAMIFRTAKRKQ